jgi:meso-butanediol dehydrogenase/(S,S)-butanediol dehydrogenase/diacetyl reductase
MMNQLAGKTAIVTGGGRGIGQGIIFALADAGADVVIADINVENAEKTAAEVESRGKRALAVKLDVTDEHSVNTGVEETIARFGQINILVNNAGVVPEHVGPETQRQDFDLCFEVNLRGIWTMTMAVLPHLKKHNAGKIVNIASIAGRRGGRGMAPYSASKAGAISLTQSLAAELGPDGINVNAICPGLLWTPMWEKLEGMFRHSKDPSIVGQRASFDAFIEKNCPLRREQTPEDIGNATVFLVSDAARNITGQALNVDGGIEMH